MMSLLCSTRRSRFSRRLSPRVNNSTTSVSKTSSCSSTRLVTWSVSYVLWLARLLKSRASRMKSSTWTSNSLLRSCKLRHFPKSSRTLSTTIDGANLRALILTLGRCSRRFKLSRSVWSRRLKKSSKRTWSSKRRKNSTLSWRTFWLVNLDPKSLNNSQSISRTWSKRLLRWRPWQLNSTCTKLKSMSTSTKLSVSLVSFKKWNVDISSRSAASRTSVKPSRRPQVVVSKEAFSRIPALNSDSLVEVSTWLFEYEKYIKTALKPIFA